MQQEIKKVKIKYGTSENLAKVFRITTRTIRNAINGSINTERARKIRKAAVEMGGDPIYESNKSSKTKKNRKR